MEIVSLKADCSYLALRNALRRFIISYRLDTYRAAPRPRDFRASLRCASDSTLLHSFFALATNCPLFPLSSIALHSSAIGLPIFHRVRLVASRRFIVFVLVSSVFHPRAFAFRSRSYRDYSILNLLFSASVASSQTHATFLFHCALTVNQRSSTNAIMADIFTEPTQATT